MARLLVVDGSRVLPSLVRRLSPRDVAVESADTFERALERLVSSPPPDGLIVNLTPADLPWQELQRLCERHSPPIPVLYESCVYNSASEAGLRTRRGQGHFLHKPCSLVHLEAEIRYLLERVTRRPDGSAPGPDARRRGPGTRRRG